MFWILGLNFGETGLVKLEKYLLKKIIQKLH